MFRLLYERVFVYDWVMVSAAVRRLRDAIDGLAADEIAGSQGADVAALWRELSRLDAQLARRLVEFDRSMEWSVEGARSCAGWLAAHVRCATGEAQHRVKVARQVAAMPVARAAWEAGAVGTRHVDALTTVRKAADADGEFAVFEPVLVDVAEQGRPEDVTNVGKQWRDALDSHLDRDGRRIREHELRGARFSRTLDGAGFLEARFDTEGAEIIATGLDRSYERAHQTGDPRSPAQQRSDAIVEIFQHYLDGQPRGSNRPHVIAVGDAATYSGEAVGLCETLRGHRLHPETMRRWSCDSFLQRALVDADGVVLDLGRATRSFTPDQYRAMVVRDGGCRWPSCDAGPDQCEGHHLDHAATGGPTDLDNGILACRGPGGHHRNLHEGGSTVTGDPNGELTFRDPDGNLIGTSRPRRPPKRIPTRTGNDLERVRQRVEALKRAA